MRLAWEESRDMEREHILVVEDEPNMRLSLEISLRSNGYDVTAVSDGEDALNLLSDSEKAKNYSLLVTDVLMRNINGIKLLDELKARNISLPELVITGYNTKEIASELKERGCEMVLYKPFSEEIFIANVKKALRK
jgi:CheY-like chemotaxis protein